MKALRLHRWLALLAACALIVSSAAYAAHGMAERTHGHSHCDLCAHFAGSAGAPAPPAVAGKAVLVVPAVAPPVATLFVARPPLGAHRPRAPPLLLPV